MGDELSRHALVRRMKAFIEARLGDPRLSPAQVAAAHHVSLRYLYKLFETEETTVANWIRRRRLERCRRDLLDPRLRDRPVSAIASRWGFTSAAHFSRLFQRRYGLPPSEFRRLRAGEDGCAAPAARCRGRAARAGGVRIIWFTESLATRPAEARLDVGGTPLTR